MQTLSQVSAIALFSCAHIVELATQPRKNAVQLSKTVKLIFWPESRLLFACESGPIIQIREPVPTCPTLIAADSL